MLKKFAMSGCSSFEALLQLFLFTLAPFKTVFVFTLFGVHLDLWTDGFHLFSVLSATISSCISCVPYLSHRGTPAMRV